MFKKFAVFTAFSFVSISFSSSNVTKLKGKLLEKQIIASEFSKKIEEKERLLLKMNHSINKIYSLLSKEDKAKIENEIRAFIKRFKKAWSCAQVKEMLTKELFDDTSDFWLFTHRIKSLTIRMALEKQLLRNLITEFEDLLYDIAIIEIELEKLTI